MPTASSASTSSRSPPALPAQPTSKCSQASKKATKLLPAPTRLCAGSRKIRWSSATRKNHPFRLPPASRKPANSASSQFGNQSLENPYRTVRTQGKTLPRDNEVDQETSEEHMGTTTLDSTSTEELAQPVAPPSGDVIVVEDLWRTYDMGMEQQVQALRGVSLRIRRNEYVAIMGP